VAGGCGKPVLSLSLVPAGVKFGIQTSARATLFHNPGVLPRTPSALNRGENRCRLAAMVALIFLALRFGVALCKSKTRLEAENAALRQQLAVLRRKVRGRVRLTSGDRLFFRAALLLVPIDPQDHNDRSSRHAGALAPCRISPLLKLEV
jgi:hypothetical protein